MIFAYPCLIFFKCRIWDMLEKMISFIEINFGCFLKYTLEIMVSNNCKYDVDVLCCWTMLEWAEFHLNNAWLLNVWLKVLGVKKAWISICFCTQNDPWFY